MKTDDDREEMYIPDSGRGVGAKKPDPKGGFDSGLDRPELDDPAGIKPDLDDPAGGSGLGLGIEPVKVWDRPRVKSDENHHD